MNFVNSNSQMRDYTRNAQDIDGFSTLNQTQSQRTIIAMAAGDGTFMNIVKETLSYGLIFATLPFGTANDLSRAFNWGTKPSEKMRNNLELLWNELLNATPTKLDVWEITVTTDDLKGKFWLC